MGADERMEISIHSTARVETQHSFPGCTEIADFNPLHREGGDGGSPDNGWQI